MSNALTRLALLLLVLAFPLGALAQQQEVELGTGVICDTAEQVKKFIVAANSGVGNQAALNTVNAETGGNACGIMTIAYIKGERIGAIRTKDGNADIYQIAVVGINLGMGCARGTPMVQYTLFLTKEEGA